MTHKPPLAAEKGRNAPDDYQRTGVLGLGATEGASGPGLAVADNERFCRCGCGEKLTGRPEKVYYDRIHKDRVRNR